MSTFVLSLSDSQATLENVGGKGISLAKLARAGIPVPDGFHITTEAYRQFVAANHLQTKILSALAARFQLDPQAVRARLAECQARLLSARALRVRPGKDDKILMAWNGLMLATAAEAARAIDDANLQHKYLMLATRSAEFWLDAVRPNGRLKRNLRQGRVTDQVFLEDYTALTDNGAAPRPGRELTQTGCPSSLAVPRVLRALAVRRGFRPRKCQAGCRAI